MWIMCRAGKGEARYIKGVADEFQSGDKVKAVHRDNERKSSLPLANRQWRETPSFSIRRTWPNGLLLLSPLTTKRGPSLGYYYSTAGNQIVILHINNHRHKQKNNI